MSSAASAYSNHTEQDIDEHSSLLPKRQITRRVTRRNLAHAKTKKLQLRALDHLQDRTYVEEHFSTLDADQVTKAAIVLSQVMDGAAGQICGRDEYHSAMVFKHRSVKSGTLLHFAIWFVAEHSADAEIIQDVLKSFEDPDDALWPASYACGNTQLAFVSAVHFAANLGQLAILKILIKHATENTSEEMRMTRDEFVSEWARLFPLTATADDFFNRDSQDLKTLFYQPIHDSTLASHGQVTLFLLKNQADPVARNIQQITPLHFVAFSGIAGGLGSSLGEDLSKIVRALQRTGKAVGAKANMSNFIPGAQNVTPLEVAVEDASRFPQEHLGLLAPCLADSSTHLTYFDDIKHIAEVTADGALSLVQLIKQKGQENQNILRRFRINAQMEGASDQLASILYTAPLAASEILDLLEVNPEVEDPAHYSLPAKTSLWGLFQNVPMRCSYQTDVIKKEGLMLPFWENRNPKAPRAGLGKEVAALHSWHDSFAPRAKRQERNAHVKHVYVVASLMPGVLDIDVFMALAHCQRDHLAIMSKKTVQGAIFCLWTNVVEQVWAVRGIFAFFDMIAYVTVSGLIHADNHYGSLCFPIIAAGNFHTVMLVVSHNVSLLRKWSQHGSDSTMAELWSPMSHWNLAYTVPMFLQALLGTIFVVDMYLRGSKQDDRTHLDDVLLAACLLLSCFRFIWMWRLSVLGSRLYSIRETFAAGAVNQMLFITFLLLFSFIVALMVLCRLHTVSLALLAYRGFLFGDGEGFNGLGMEVDHDAVPKQGALIGFAVFGSFFFNVIVLNIIIAIYGNEYDRVQLQTPSLFMMGRADYCVKAVLSTYVISWRGESFNRSLTTLALASIVGGVVVGKLGTNIFMSAALLAFGQVLLPMSMIQCSWFSPEGQDSDDNQRYLWMCHPRDWQWKSSEDRQDDGEDNQEDVEEKLHELDDKVTGLDSKMDQIMNLLADGPQPSVYGGTAFSSPNLRPSPLKNRATSGAL